MKAFVKMMPVVIAALMTACSSENSIDEPQKPSDSRQFVTINIDNTAASRAGRLLSSSQATEQIDNVKLILTDELNTVVWTKTFENWGEGNTAVSWIDADQHRVAQIEIPKDEYRMANGAKYNVYAVGYCNNSDYNLQPVTDAVVGTSFGATTSLVLNSRMAEELFAGSCAMVGNEEGVNEDLEMSRQVSGVYTYMCKIPYVKTTSGYIGRYLQLVASNMQNELTLGCYGFNEYVATTDCPAGMNTIYTIDLKDWFENLVEEVDVEGFKTGCLAPGANWKGDPAKYAEGSVYAGAFVLPFVKTNDVTLRLLLTTDAAGQNVIRSWNILLPDNASQLSTYVLNRYNGRAWVTDAVTDSQKYYNVLRNHLYALGQHPFDNIVADPANPGEEDIPMPINNKQDLMIRVNHNWSSIVIMGIE